MTGRVNPRNYGYSYTYYYVTTYLIGIAIGIGIESLLISVADSYPVIPAKAGIQSYAETGFPPKIRGNDRGSHIIVEINYQSTQQPIFSIPIAIPSATYHPNTDKKPPHPNVNLNCQYLLHNDAL